MALVMNSVGRGGVNRRADVEVVQTLLNKHLTDLTPLRPLTVDGRIGPHTLEAIEQFQSRVLHLDPPTGCVEPYGKTLRELGHRKGNTHCKQTVQTQAKLVGTAEKEVTEPKWSSLASGEVGQSELAGYVDNNPRILEYLSTFKYLSQSLYDKSAGVYCSNVDETPWCAAFVNWCLIQAGRSHGPSARAQDWITYGTALDVPVPGAITVIYKKPKVKADHKTTRSGWHVGFYVRSDGTSITLLGGNQGDTVSEHVFKGWTVKGYRWPS